MQRYDSVAIKATKTNEGFIRDAPIVGRTGILKYQNAVCMNYSKEFCFKKFTSS